MGKIFFLLLVVSSVYFETQGAPKRTKSQYYQVPGPYRVGAVDDVTVTMCHDIHGAITGTASFSSDSPDITLASHTCNNFNMSETNCCSATFHINVTFEGSNTGTIEIPYFEGTYLAGKLHWGVIYESIDPSIGTLCSIKKPGSILNINNGSVGEVIPIVGAPFELVYSSDFSSDFTTSLPMLKNPFFGPSMWMPSIQSYYDVSKKRLFMGSGVAVYSESKILSNGNLFVVSPKQDEAYIFSPSGKHLQTQSTLTGYVKYSFNYDVATSKLKSIVDAFGNQTNFYYNGLGALTGITAPYGQVTNISSNANGLIASVTNPKNEAFYFTYKSGTELLETVTFPNGKISTFLYDAYGKLTSDSNTGGSLGTITRTANGTSDAITQTSSLGRVTTFQTGKASKEYSYGSEQTLFGGVFSTTETGSGVNRFTPYSSTTTSTVNDERFGNLHKRLSSSTVTINGTSRLTSYSQVVSTNAPSDFFSYSSITNTATTNGKSSTQVYDAITRTNTFTSPLGKTATFTLDSFERPVSSAIGNDIATTYNYDGDGRLAGSIQGIKNQKTYVYNSSGLVSSVTNSRGEVISYSYDMAGRVTQVFLPDLRVIGYSYDAHGNLASITPPGRPTHNFWYNLFDKVSKYLPPSLVGVVSKDTVYTYNSEKQLTQIVRPDGPPVDFIYSATTGLLISSGNSFGRFAYTYKPNSDQWDVVSSPDDYNNTFSWYGKEMKTDAQRQTSSNLLFGKTTIGFDSEHRPSSRTIQGRSSATTYTRSTVYNNDGSPTQIGSLNLTYSHPSGRLSTTSLDKISDARTYDGYGYLATYTATYTPISGTPVVLYSYALSRDIGSRISGKTETVQGVTDTYVYSYDIAGRLTQVLKNGSVYSSYVYDSNGNRISGLTGGVPFTSTFDDQDRLLTYNSKTYSYNANGELIQVQVTPTTQNLYTYDFFGKLKQTTLTNGVVLSYSYDGLGRRIRKMENSTFKYHYLYEEGERIAAHVNNSGVIQKEYVYGEHVNSADYIIVGAIKYRIIKDHLGSPRLVVNTTDGTVSQRMDYNDLGKVTSDTNQGFQHFGFAGGIYDGQSKLVKFGARDYDPETGRWTSKDPIGFDGGDTNLYGYVINDPVNLVDPEGTFPLAAAAAFAGAYLLSSQTDTPDAATNELWQVPLAGLTAGAVVEGAGAMCAVANSNRFIRVGEGKFPVPFSKRISIGGEKGKKFEIGISPKGRIDVKIGSERYTIRKGN